MGDRFITAYHQAQRSSLDSIEKNGINRGKPSDKDTDDIKKTNDFLDRFRTKEQVSAGVSRGGVLYAYMMFGDNVYDISSGSLVLPDSLVDNDHVMVGVRVKVSACWVSDLDLYDAVRGALGIGDDQVAEGLSEKYWRRVVMYEDYESGQITRPELLITGDILAQNIISTVG